jgi:hypothetical protein
VVLAVSPLQRTSVGAHRSHHPARTDRLSPANLCLQLCRFKIDLPVVEHRCPAFVQQVAFIQPDRTIILTTGAELPAPGCSVRPLTSDNPK